MSGPDTDTDDDHVQQRVVSASDSSPLRTEAASSVFNWRPAGATAAPAAAGAGDIPCITGCVHDPDHEGRCELAEQLQQPPEKEETMATKRNGAARARKSSRGSPQLSICTALLQHGDLSREAIGQTLTDLTPAQISSALNNAKSHDRLTWVEKDQVYRLTAAGKKWAESASAPEATDPAATTKTRRGGAAKKTAHRRGRAAKSEKVDTSPAATEEAPPAHTFRVAVMNDGSFFIAKDGASIELDADEHAEMLRYLERMAEEVA